MVSATEIVALEDRLTREWHGPAARTDAVFPAPAGKSGGRRGAESEWLSLVARQHKANFDLWHIEDEARAPGASDAEIADVKRRIDRTNQLRNDLVEELDRAMQSWLEERTDHRSAFDSRAEDLPHARRGGAEECAAGACGTQSRAAQDSRRAAHRPCRVSRCAVAGDTWRHTALQTLPAI